MANINLGKVALSAGGIHTTTESYEKLDIVNYQGGSYLAKKNVPTGIAIENNEYWQLLAAKGEQGTNVGDLVIASSTQPTDPNTKIWIKEDSEEEYTVLTTDDIDDNADEGNTNVIWSADKTWHEFDKYYNNYNIFEFSQGSLAAADGRKLNSTTRAVTVLKNNNCKTSILEVNNTITTKMKLAVYYYDQYGIYITNNSYYWDHPLLTNDTLRLSLDNYPKFRILVSLNDITITDQALEDLSNCISFYYLEEIYNLIKTNYQNHILRNEYDNISDKIHLSDNYYIDGSGEFVIHENDKITEFIYLNPGDFIFCKLITENEKYLNMASYDLEENFIQRITTNTATNIGNKFKLTLNYTNKTNIPQLIRFSSGENPESFTIIKCKKDSCKNNNIISLGHRGGNNKNVSPILPENTMLSFQQAKNRGFNWIETDIHRTSDGIYVTIHDRIINRTARYSDGSEIETDIGINEITYAEALTYDFGIYINEEYKGIKIPTFEEVLQYCKMVGLKIQFEIKDTISINQIPEIITLIEKYGMENAVMITSFNYDKLKYIKDNYDSYNLAFITNTIDQTYLTQLESLKSSMHETVAAISKSSTDAEFLLVKAVADAINIWTINTEGEINDLQKYAKYYTTDGPKVEDAFYKYAITLY